VDTILIGVNCKGETVIVDRTRATAVAAAPESHDQTMDEKEKKIEEKMDEKLGLVEQGSRSEGAMRA